MQVQTYGLILIASTLTMAVLILVNATLFKVKRQTVAIVERSGRFVRKSTPGLRVKIPFIETVVGRLTMSVQQKDVTVDTKTADSIVARISVTIQFYVLPERALDAFYRQHDITLKINSRVSDAISAMIPKMKLKDVFAEKNDISNIMQKELSRMSEGLGYGILMPLVTEIDPRGKADILHNKSVQLSDCIQ